MGFSWLDLESIPSANSRLIALPYFQKVAESMRLSALAALDQARQSGGGKVCAAPSPVLFPEP